MKTLTNRNKMILVIVGIIAVVAIALGAVMTQAPNATLVGTAVIQFIPANPTIVLGQLLGNPYVTGTNCSLTSSNTNVVTIFNVSFAAAQTSYTLRSQGVGQATITAACVEGVATTLVTVASPTATPAPSPTRTPIPVPISPTNPTLTVGTTRQFSPSWGTWTSSNSNVVSIGANALATAHSVGTATLSFSSPGYVSASTTVTVTAVDVGFNPGAIGTNVRAIAVQPDGKILVGGNFTTLAGQPRYNLGRLNADGTIDATFNASPNSIVTSLAVQSDGKILVAGAFTQITGRSTRYLARLTPQGAFDLASPFPFSQVNAIAVQPDGKFVAIGQVNDGYSNSKYIIRFNADGKQDTSAWEIIMLNYTGSATLLRQPDGKFVVGVNFKNGTLRMWVPPQNPTQYNEDAVRSYVFRLNADLSLDGSFIPYVNGPVNAFAVHNFNSTVSIMLGGVFSLVSGRAVTDFESVAMANGALNPAWTHPSLSGTGNTVNALATRLDGTVWAGGNFTYSGGQNLTALTANPPANSVNGTVYALAVHPDGSLLVGGAFTYVNGVARSNIARIK